MYICVRGGGVVVERRILNSICFWCINMRIECSLPKIIFDKWLKLSIDLSLWKFWTFLNSTYTNRMHTHQAINSLRESLFIFSSYRIMHFDCAPKNCYVFIAKLILQLFGKIERSRGNRWFIMCIYRNWIDLQRPKYNFNLDKYFRFVEISKTSQRIWRCELQTSHKKCVNQYNYHNINRTVSFVHIFSLFHDYTTGHTQRDRPKALTHKLDGKFPTQDLLKTQRKNSQSNSGFAVSIGQSVIFFYYFCLCCCCKCSHFADTLDRCIRYVHLSFYTTNTSFQWTKNWLRCIIAIKSILTENNNNRTNFILVTHSVDLCKQSLSFKQHTQTGRERNPKRTTK